jgi:hypothetical protein
MAKTQDGTDNKPRKKKNSSAQIVLVFGLLSGVVFLPTTVLLGVGMVPTLVALFAARTKTRARAITIGVMNFAGCTLFLLQLWTQGHDFDQAFAIISNPLNIVVMYSAAAAGAMLDWAVTGIVAGVVYQKGISRQKYIARRQEELVERWGPEVTGKIRLDEYGFPIRAVDADEHA